MSDDFAAASSSPSDAATEAEENYRADERMLIVIGGIVGGVKIIVFVAPTFVVVIKTSDISPSGSYGGTCIFVAVRS